MLGYVLIFVIVVVLVGGKKKQFELPLNDEERALFDADIFCKNESRLIKMEKADEIIVVDCTLNSTVLLQCKYCEETDNGLPKLWSKQRHIFIGNITEVQLDMNTNVSKSLLFETKEHSLVIRNLQESDLGLYFCRAPYVDTPDKSFNYLIDLNVRGPEEIVGSLSDLRNYTEMYLMRINSDIANKSFSVHELTVKMRVFSDWSDWSECDSCFRKEGVKSRVGRCRVKPICQNTNTCIQQRNLFKGIVFNDNQNQEFTDLGEGEVPNVDDVKEIILEFGMALSCRSTLLRTLVPELFNLTSQMPDFILNEKCNIPCKGRRMRKGPRYKKSIILAKGAHLTLVCPDSTVNSDVRWDHNKVQLSPNEGADYIPGSAEPRLYVDSFNTLYLFDVSDKEAGNFTCYVDGVRMQEIKIIVLTRSLFFTKEFTRHLKYLGFVFLLCFVGYIAGVIVMFVKTQAEKKERKARKKCRDKEKLLQRTCAGSESDTD